MSRSKEAVTADAILWDFDGTLADSAAKNITITRQILEKVAPELTGDNLPRWLRSVADYQRAIHNTENWRDLYREFFGMAEADIRTAGPMWQTYQDQDDTDVRLFEGVLETIAKLADRPQGVSSANSSKNIRRVLAEHGIEDAFRSIVGYERFSPDRQKPAADPGLECLRGVLPEVRGKTILYVGDHVADVIFARNIGARLHPSCRVISVIVTYSGADPGSWREQPDRIISHPSELLEF
ncbi:MAG: HAD family hydrolase [Lysobacterales bacterium]|jgi:phosphoglycolate phosphatase-like HAD superfamily hydrolase